MSGARISSVVGNSGVAFTRSAAAAAPMFRFIATTSLSLPRLSSSSTSSSSTSSSSTTLKRCWRRTRSSCGFCFGSTTVLRGGAARPHGGDGENGLFLARSTTTRLYSSSSSSSAKDEEDKVLPSFSKKHRFITYITDIEGDRDYLQRYAEQSRVVCMRPLSENDKAFDTTISPPLDFPYDHCLDFVRHDKDNSDTLVFGGDIWDQGGFDLYVIRQLLHFQRRYPQRVYFILGNRDINKLRVISELGSSCDENDKENDPTPSIKMPPHHPGVYWLRGTQRLGDPDGINNSELDDPVKRCQWMLQSTMGSPRAFQYRQEELAELASRSGDKVDNKNDNGATEKDVVKSYRKSCHPNGEMGQYMKVGHLALQIGDVLFVHGSLPLTCDVLQQANKDAPPSRLWGGENDDNNNDLTFAMPWLDPGVSAKQVQVESIADWIHALNQFGRDEVATWRQAPATGIWSLVGGYHNLPNDDMRAGSKLLQYGMGWYPDRTRNPTVVYNSWGTDGMPRRFFPLDDQHDSEISSNVTTNVAAATASTRSAYFQATQSFFRASGIRLICSGHQPQGDMPNAIRVPLGIDDDTDEMEKENVNDHNISRKNLQNSDMIQKENAWILCCDTSYSGDVFWCHDNHNNNTNDKTTSLDISQADRQGSLSGRGKVAVSEVLLTHNMATNQITNVICHGVLSDGSRYETKPLEWVPSSNHVQGDKDDDSSSLLRVGMLARGPRVPSVDASPHKGPWWTRAALADGSYILTAGKGFNSWNYRVF